jgi:dihydrodiol dehydrogenase / D-xylose 1-dehydrogenase (NADP)
MKEKIRWGILGPGKIAHSFAKGLKSLPGAELAAVASRSAGRAAAFAKEFGIPKAYGSYQELADDPEIDIVYVATPHPAHAEFTLMCLEAGKAVICEKPLAVNEEQARTMAALAQKKDLFLTEAMWTRYLPCTRRIMELIGSGAIGDVRMVKADFGFRCPWEPENRLLDPNLGGGALLDVGVYTVSYASMVFGGLMPQKVASAAAIGETGVDETFSAVLEYGDGRLAALSGAVRVDLTNDAWILGTTGRIHVPDFWHAHSFELSRRDGETGSFEVPFDSNGYCHEAAYAMDCLRNGRKDSELMPLAETIRVVRTMDAIRREWSVQARP